MTNIKKLALIIATTVITTNIAFAGTNKEETRKENENMKQKILDNKAILEKEREMLFPKQESYDISTITVTFSPKNQEDDIVSELIAMNELLIKTNNINQTINNYGNIKEYESQSQSILSNTLSRVSQERIMNYKYKQEDGVINSVDIKLSNVKSYKLRETDDNKYTLFFNIKNEKLGKSNEQLNSDEYSLSKIPSIKTDELNQAVVLKKGEYKVVNIYQNLPNDKDIGKEYTATIMKLTQ
jgi:hypothetical protein